MNITKSLSLLFVQASIFQSLYYKLPDLASNVKFETLHQASSQQGTSKKGGGHK